jgi:hypothetical protein
MHEKVLGFGAARDHFPRSARAIVVTLRRRDRKSGPVCMSLVEASGSWCYLRLSPFFVHLRLCLKTR